MKTAGQGVAHVSRKREPVSGDMRKNKQIERFQRLLINRNRSRRGKGFKFLQKVLYEAHLLKVGK
ncbi:hypothetical protein EGJ57_08200 [Brucella anthropi]|nr:hypothetical protein EGJ57_08200 [Brucella anthropi]